MSEVTQLATSLMTEPKSDEIEIPPTSLNSKPNVGEQLQVARTIQNLSIEQIAARLKRSARQIAEIEAGNYVVLRDYSSARGLVRSYARLLKLDVTPLLSALAAELAACPAQFPNGAAEQPSLGTPFAAGRMPWLGRPHARPQRFWGGVLIALLCMIVVVVYRDEIKQFGRINVAAENDNAENHTTMIAEKENAPAVTVPPPAPPTTNNTLELKFNQDSWVQVKRLDGSKVISTLYKAGSKEMIEVREPLDIVIGFAPGVDATLRGEKLSLQAQTNSNVVNLTIK